MNVTCGSCPAKYAVPDEKVRGKKARIKCKHCGAEIAIDGTQLSASERPGASAVDQRWSSIPAVAEHPAQAPIAQPKTPGSDAETRTKATAQASQAAKPKTLSEAPTKSAATPKGASQNPTELAANPLAKSSTGYAPVNATRPASPTLGATKLGASPARLDPAPPKQALASTAKDPGPQRVAPTGTPLGGIGATDAQKPKPAFQSASPAPRPLGSTSSSPSAGISASSPARAANPQASPAGAERVPASPKGKVALGRIQPKAVTNRTGGLDLDQSAKPSPEGQANPGKPEVPAAPREADLQVARRASRQQTMLGLAAPQGITRAAPPAPSFAVRPEVASPTETASTPHGGSPPTDTDAGRSAKQTLLGGIQAPKFDPPTRVSGQSTSGNSVTNQPDRAAVVDPGNAGATSQPKQSTPPPEGLWTVAFADSTQREVTVSDLAELYRTGRVGRDNLVWREGMSDWAMLETLSELYQMVTARPLSLIPDSEEPITQHALPLPVNNDTAADGLPPRASVPPGPLRQSSEAPIKPESGVAWSEPGTWSKDDQPTSTNPISAGIEDEISQVLSASVAEGEPLSDLRTVGSEPIDRLSGTPRPLAHAPEAPLTNAATRPSEAVPGRARQSKRPSQRPSDTQTPFTISARKGAPLWPFVALVVLLIAGGGVVAVYLTKNPPGAHEFLTRSLPGPVQDLLGRSEQAVATAEPPSQPNQHAAPQETSPAATVVPPEEPEPAAPTGPARTYPARTAAPAKPKTAPVEAAEPAPLTDAPFDAERASAAVESLNSKIQACRGTAPAGTGTVRVTFGPTGEATSATVAGQYAASDVSLCLIDLYRQLRVPPFAGEPKTVSHEFNLQ